MALMLAGADRASTFTHLMMPSPVDWSCDAPQVTMVSPA
jgi:hypothetical protein